MNQTAKEYHVKAIILDKICHDMMLDERMPEAADYVLRFMEKIEFMKLYIFMVMLDVRWQWLD